MNSIFRFDFRHFRGDLFGGLTAGIVALPLALAFGVSSGLGPSSGLYGAIFVSFFCGPFWRNPYSNLWTHRPNDGGEDGFYRRDAR